MPTPSHASLDLADVCSQLDDRGFAIAPTLLSREECLAACALYDSPSAFRKTITMARHGYGRGEYKYFQYPLPKLVDTLRSTLYPPLVSLANEWCARMNLETRFPATHADFVQRCHAAGQTRPTPLMLRYGEGDYNCLHQDLYGEHVFPVQVAILLSDPGADFEGGELVLTEQRPRMQSRASVLSLRQGDALFFAVHQRPVRGTRGDYRVNMRHGVSEVRAGRRHTLGIIFHDAT